jgi:hypothetical protein
MGDPTGIEPVPEGVGVAGLTAPLSPGAGSVLAVIWKRRGTGQERSELGRG